MPVIHFYTADGLQNMQNTYDSLMKAIDDNIAKLATLIDDNEAWRKLNIENTYLIIDSSKLRRQIEMLRGEPIIMPDKR